MSFTFRRSLLSLVESDFVWSFPPRAHHQAVMQQQTLNFLSEEFRLCESRDLERTLHSLFHDHIHRERPPDIAWPYALPLKIA